MRICGRFQKTVCYISDLRVREFGEIAPISTEQSASKDDKDMYFGAENAIDLETFFQAAADSNEKYWFKATLDQVYCIEKVARYKKWFTTLNMDVDTWICTKDNCSHCEGSLYCQFYTLTVSIERTSPPSSQLPSHPDCRYGDTVKLNTTHVYFTDLVVSEIVIIGKQGTVRNFFTTVHFNMFSGIKKRCST